MVNHLLYKRTTGKTSALTETSSVVCAFSSILATKRFRNQCSKNTYMHTSYMWAQKNFSVFLLRPFKSPICSQILFPLLPRPLQPSPFPPGPLHFIISAIPSVISGHRLLTRRGRPVKQAWLNALCPSISCT